MSSSSSRQRLDKLLVARGLVVSRSQAESEIRLGHVKVDGQIIRKAGHSVGSDVNASLTRQTRYVSRAAYKLESVAEKLQLTFKSKAILDVGSSTGGFTDLSLQRGARKVIAVDVGTDQLHPQLRADERIELYEKTDIRNVQELSEIPDMVLMDLSFISLREIIPHISRLVGSRSQIVAMVKPQFEGGSSAKHKGVIKNDRMRRDILKSFEQWVKQYCAILNKADSDVAGQKGNKERFYLLKANGSINKK